MMDAKDRNYRVDAKDRDYRVWQKIFKTLVHMIQIQRTEIESLADDCKLLEHHVRVQRDRWISEVTLLKDHISMIERSAEMDKMLLDAKFALLIAMKKKKASMYKKKSEIPEHLQHKSQLQEFAQRSGLPPPFYQTINEGRPPDLKFRAYVFIDGAKYSSAETFLNRKAAEHDVAKIALENLPLRLKDESLHQISQDTMFCKAILMEFADKMNLLKPIYTTIDQPGALLPIFITTVVFDGKTYTGNPGKNKKEAEQIAARTVLQAILTSSSRTILSVMIKSKAKHFAPPNQGGYPNSETYSEVPAAVPHDTVPAAQPCVPPSKKPKLELVSEFSSSLDGNVTVGVLFGVGSGSVEPACDPQLSVSSGPSDTLPLPLLKKPSGELEATIGRSGGSKTQWKKHKKKQARRDPGGPKV